MDRIPIMEQFYSLQGEGFWSGEAAYFIRLAGCDVGCHWCDVKDSWEATDDQLQEIENIVEHAVASGTKRVVITGGEPMMYALGELTTALKEAGLIIHLETSGAHPYTGNFDWICLSPKKFKPVIEEWYKLADELKVIVFNENDFKWGEEKASNCDLEHTICFFQPEWEKRDEMTPKIIRYVKDNPNWRLSLQTHKYVNIP